MNAEKARKEHQAIKKQVVEEKSSSKVRAYFEFLSGTCNWEQQNIVRDHELLEFVSGKRQKRFGAAKPFSLSQKTATEVNKPETPCIHTIWKEPDCSC